MIYNTNYLTKFVQNLFTITRSTNFYTSTLVSMINKSGVGKKEKNFFIEDKKTLKEKIISTTGLSHASTMAMHESGFELQAKDVFYKKVHVSESMHFAFFFTIHLLLNSWRHTFSTSCKCLLTSNLIYQNTFPIVLHACQVSTHCSFFFPQMWCVYDEPTTSTPILIDQ